MEKGLPDAENMRGVGMTWSDCRGPGRPDRLRTVRPHLDRKRRFRRAPLNLVAATFTVNQWYAGGSGSTATVDFTPPEAGQSSDDSGPSFGVGTRLLVSGETVAGRSARRRHGVGMRLYRLLRQGNRGQLASRVQLSAWPYNRLIQRSLNAHLALVIFIER